MELNFTHDRDMMQVILRMKGNEDFRRIMDALKGHRADVYSAMETTNGNDLYRYAGRTGVLSELIEQVEKAEDTIQKMAETEKAETARNI